MTDYIDRKSLRDALYEQDAITMKGVAIINRFPAADVAPVRHGRWLKHYRSGVAVAEGCVSSRCDMWNERETNYFPYCGAKMDGEENAED